MVQYRWRALPFNAKLSSGKIFGYTLNEFSGFLDVLFAIADLPNGWNLRFVKPANVFVIKNKSEGFILGLNFSKAIAGLCSIQVMNVKGIKEMEYATLNVLGMKIEATLSIPKDVVSDYLHPFNKASKDKESYKNLKLYKEFFSGDEKLRKLVTQLNNEITKHGGGNCMFVNPIFQGRDISTDSDLCFLVMPFNYKREDILEKVVKPVIKKKCGLKVLKSGDKKGPNQNMMENIWTYINRSSVIIADISDCNPNVFYELGICHTLGKPVILICDKDSYNKEELPFDIRGLHVIFYSDSGSGPTKLTNDIVEAIQNMRKQLNIIYN